MKLSKCVRGVDIVIIAVENAVAQHLHVNSQSVSENLAANPAVWSVRETGDFIVVINNLLALPVIIRHPQRFNDSRSFVTAFKREFLQLLEAAPVPHAKIKLIRDDLFKTITFTRRIPAATRTQLQVYQNILTGPSTIIDWDSEPTNTDLALQIAEQTELTNPASGEKVAVMDLVEDYIMTDYQLPAHPQLNDHNRSYLFRTASLNDVMEGTAVTEKILTEYKSYLNDHQKSDRVIDRDLDVANDYLAYCEANGTSFLDDLGLTYNYLLHYEEINSVRLSDAQLWDKGTALRDFAQFMRAEDLFSAADFDQFIQVVAQSFNDLHSKQRSYYLARLLHGMQQQVRQQRSSLEHSYRYANKRYRLQVELLDYQPTMWRQMTVDGNTRLDTLCYLILASFHADGHHLFEVTDQDNTYHLPALDNGMDNSGNLLTRWVGEYPVGASLVLTYDFGDLWRFKITVEEVKKQLPLHSTDSAKLIDGQGTGIIDDIGGPDGLSQAAKDVSTP